MRELSLDNTQITDAGGGNVQGGRIEWPNGTLASQEAKTLRITAIIKADLKHGKAIQVSTKISGGSAAVVSDTVKINILGRLPRTGRITLLPLKQSKTKQAIPTLWMWPPLMIAGIAVGMMYGRERILL